MERGFKENGKRMERGWKCGIRIIQERNNTGKENGNTGKGEKEHSGERRK